MQIVHSLLNQPIVRLLVVFCAATAPVYAVAQLMNEATPLPGITTSGQPKEAELAELAERGIVAVIDLRGPNEDRGFDEPEAVQRLGMKYMALPVTGLDSVTYDNAAALSSLLEEANGPVLIHCASSNRVGALLSLRQSLLGLDDDAALAIGVEAGLSSPALRDAVESRLRDRDQSPDDGP